MLEATITSASLLKKLIDAIKDFVTEANWECDSQGISLQAMDTSHVALVALLLKSDGFDGGYRCDRNMTLGINVQSMAKLLKCASADDGVGLSAMDSGEELVFTFESSRGGRVAEYALKLLDIDSQQLGVPEPEYEASIEMPSAELLRVCRDLSSVGENVKISVGKSTVSFSVDGEMGSGSVTLKQSSTVDEEGDQGVSIHQSSTGPISLDFAIKYLTGFAKAAPLSQRVRFHMSMQAPLLVEYQIEGTGYLRFYLAPKIEDGDAEQMGDGVGAADVDMGDGVQVKHEQVVDDY